MAEQQMDFRRQIGIFNPDLYNTTIGVIGAGGIGSSFITVLAKMGVKNIEVWDFDLIEDYNVPSQFLPLTPGIHKVVALKEQVKYLTGVEITIHQEPFTPESLQGRLCPSIIVMAVDNMACRKMIYETVIDAIGLEFIIDGRMSGETYTIVSTLSDYMESWHEDPAEPIPCTEKAIIYNTMSIGSDMANCAKKFMMSQKVPKVIKGDCKEFIKIQGDDYKWIIHRQQ